MSPGSHRRQPASPTGPTVVVTGANNGIGFEGAQVLVRRGAHVLMAVRDTARGDAAAARLDGPGSASVLQVDLADLDQISDFAAALLEQHDT